MVFISTALVLSFLSRIYSDRLYTVSSAESRPLKLNYSLKINQRKVEVNQEKKSFITTILLSAHLPSEHLEHS